MTAKKNKIAYFIPSSFYLLNDNVVSSWCIESVQKKKPQNSQKVIFSKNLCAEYY